MMKMLKEKFDLRVLSIMLVVGFPIMLFTEVAFGRTIPSWIVWSAWLIILLVVSFLAKRFGL